MFHSRRNAFHAMGVDTGQYVIWYRIYRFRQIILNTFFSEIDTSSICSDNPLPEPMLTKFYDATWRH